MPRKHLLLSLLLTGCSAQCEGSIENTLNVDQAKEMISKDIATKLGTAPKTVECPKEVVSGKGKTFDCTFATGDGVDRVANVEQTDDEGNVRVSYKPALISVAEITQKIQSNLTEGLGADLVIDCGKLWKTQGVAFSCEANTDAKTGSVAVTWNDSELQFQAELSNRDDAPEAEDQEPEDQPEDELEDQPEDQPEDALEEPEEP